MIKLLRSKYTFLSIIVICMLVYLILFYSQNNISSKFNENVNILTIKSTTHKKSNTASDNYIQWLKPDATSDESGQWPNSDTKSQEYIQWSAPDTIRDKSVQMSASDTTMEEANQIILTHDTTSDESIQLSNSDKNSNGSIQRVKPNEKSDGFVQRPNYESNGNKTIQQLNPYADSPRYKSGQCKNPYKEANYVETSKDIFILGAAARNTTIKTTWDEMVVYGMMYKNKKLRKSLACCFRYQNNYTIKSNVYKEYAHYSISNTRLGFLYTYCRIPRKRYRDSTMLPIEVALINAVSMTCESKHAKFIKSIYPRREPKGSFAITTKISHGNISPDLIINWMEAYRWLGVTKVITYAYPNLNADARKVLEYYARTGFLDLYSYELADSTFFSQHLNVYGIRFLTQFYIGAGGDTSKSIFLTQHREREVKEPKWNRPKFIFHPSDIELAFTSVLIPKDKRKKRFDLPAGIASLSALYT